MLEGCRLLEPSDCCLEHSGEMVAGVARCLSLGLINVAFSSLLILPSHSHCGSL